MRNIAPLNIRISYSFQLYAISIKNKHIIPEKQQLTNTSIDFAYSKHYMYCICTICSKLNFENKEHTNLYKCIFTMYYVVRDLRRMTYQAKQRVKKEKPNDETKKTTATTHIRSYPQQYKVETVTDLPFIL